MPQPLVKQMPIIKQVVVGLMVLILAVYFYTNGRKLTHFAEQWSQFQQGQAAPVAMVMLGNETVWKKPLLSTGFYDGSGSKQVHYITLDRALMQKLVNARDKVLVVVDSGKPVRPDFQRDGGMARADMPQRRIYFSSADDFDALARAAWNENVQGWKIVRCVPAALCKTVTLSSEEWARVGGPYLDTDDESSRRGMPRGRWLWGPQTTINVHSKNNRRVVMQVNMLGLLPDQRIAFQGAASKVQRVKIKNERFAIAGKDYYPMSFIVYLDLKQGDNTLQIKYSSWTRPENEGAYPLAAYLTGVVIK